MSARASPAVPYAIAVALISLALHFAWEWAQCQPFFVHGAIPPTTAAMLVATLGDLGLTFLAYVATAAATRAWDWPLRPWGWRGWLSLEASAVGLSLLIEWRALETARWSYTAASPVLPGIPVSIVPMLQLMVLFPASFWLARLRCARQAASL